MARDQAKWDFDESVSLSYSNPFFTGFYFICSSHIHSAGSVYAIWTTRRHACMNYGFFTIQIRTRYGCTRYVFLETQVLWDTGFQNPSTKNGSEPGRNTPGNGEGARFSDYLILCLPGSHEEP